MSGSSISLPSARDAKSSGERSAIDLAALEATARQIVARGGRYAFAYTEDGAIGVVMRVLVENALIAKVDAALSEPDEATELARLARERDQLAVIASDRDAMWLRIARGESERTDRLKAALSLAAYGLESAATHHDCATCEARAAVARDTLSSEVLPLGSEPPCDEGNPATDEHK